MNPRVLVSPVNAGPGSDPSACRKRVSLVTSVLSAGCHASFWPGSHSTTSPSESATRPPRSPAGRLSSLLTGRLGRPWFSPLHDFPPSSERNTPFAPAATTSSSLRGDTARSRKLFPRIEDERNALRFSQLAPPSSDRYANLPNA